MDIGIHATGLLSLGVVTWALGHGLFPQVYTGWAPQTYWATGFTSALLLFLSVFLHEMSHALTAKVFGLPVKSITLFLFGGVSNLGRDPPTAKAELVVSAMGPVASLAIGGVMWAVFFLAISDPTEPVAAVVAYMGVINVLIAGFNMLPGFPLDGGRILRAIVWAKTKDSVKATRIASRAGQVVAFGLVGLGFVHMFFGNLLGGMWVAFVGWFLFMAATGSHSESVATPEPKPAEQPLPEPIPLFPLAPEPVPVEPATEAPPGRERKAA
jgi:Zn-dependent protease